jgi:hypothetical protein
LVIATRSVDADYIPSLAETTPEDRIMAAVINPQSSRPLIFLLISVLPT